MSDPTSEQSTADRLDTLQDELRASLSDAQWRLYAAIDRLQASEWLEDQERFTTELIRHFRWPAPAVWTVARHLWEQPPGDVGVCCEAQPIGADHA